MILVEVTGPVPGPLSGGQIGEVAGEAGVWGLFFEDRTTGPAAMVVHAAAAAARPARVGAWLPHGDPELAAAHLAVLDRTTGHRAFGLAEDASFAAEVEARAGVPVLHRRGDGWRNDRLGEFSPSTTLVRRSVEDLLTPAIGLSDRERR